MKTVNEMAIEAWGADHEIFWFDDDGIERFAALVRVDENEECACLCDALERTKVYGAKECAEGIRVRGKA